LRTSDDNFNTSQQTTFITGFIRKVLFSGVIIMVAGKMFYTNLIIVMVVGNYIMGKKNATCQKDEYYGCNFSDHLIYLQRAKIRFFKNKSQSLCKQQQNHISLKKHFD
jgi:hypothetical protein